MLYRPDIQRAADAVLAGGVVVYPTEGVFGLGCLPDDARAVAQILRIKQRPAHKGMILIGSSLEQLMPWIEPTDEELGNLRSEVSHPTTWVVTASQCTPEWITGGRNSVAVRICSHPVAAALCDAANSALVSTSANRSGRPAANNPITARYITRNLCQAFVNGHTDPSLGSSEIRRASSGEVLRSA